MDRSRPRSARPRARSRAVDDVGLRGRAGRVLIALAQPGEAPHPVAWAVVAAYAIAARTDFPIGSGHVVPTQLFLVPLFVLAPAALVPALVYAGLALGVLGEAVLGRTRGDRLAYCGGDAMHALGPALVSCCSRAARRSRPRVVGDRAGVRRPAGVRLPLLEPARPARLRHPRPSSTPRCCCRCGASTPRWPRSGCWPPRRRYHFPLAALGPLPLVALLAVMAADRSRRIEHAHDRLEALNRERRRREAAVQRLGDAFATNLDRDAVLELVGRSATEALDGEAGARRAVRRRSAATGRRRRLAPAIDALLDAAERRALRRRARTPPRQPPDGLHAIAALVGDGAEPVGVVAVARRAPFSDEERSLLAYLCGQAAVSAANVVHHELLREAEARLRHQAFHDALTGLAEPRAARRARRRRARAQRDARHRRRRRALHRPRRLQARQRHARPRRRRRAAGLDRAAGSASACARATPPRGSAATSSRSCSRAWRPPGRARRSPSASGGRCRSRSTSAGASSSCTRASASCTGSRARTARTCCARPTSRCTRPSPAAATASSPSGPTCSATPTPARELANDLRGAVERGELELRYQPIVDLADGRTCAIEALARWRHPRRGLLEPAAFITLAEQTGLIDDLGRCILDEACRAGRRLARRRRRAEGDRERLLRAAAQRRRSRSRWRSRSSSTACRRRGSMLEVTESVAIDTDAETAADAGGSCAASASGSRSTTSARATRRSATSPARRSTCSSSTARSWPASTTTPSRRGWSAP